MKHKILSYNSKFHPGSETSGGGNVFLRVGTQFFSLLDIHFCHLVVVNKAKDERMLQQIFTATKTTPKSLIATFKELFYMKHMIQEILICII